MRPKSDATSLAIPRQQSNGTGFDGKTDTLADLDPQRIRHVDRERAGGRAGYNQPLPVADEADRVNAPAKVRTLFGLLFTPTFYVFVRALPARVTGVWHLIHGLRA